MTAGWLASSRHPVAPEAASLGRCGLSRLSAQQVLWGLQLMSAKLQGGERHHVLGKTQQIRTNWRSTGMERGHGALTGPGRATGKKHPWSTQGSQKLSYSSALSLGIRTDLQTYWFLKYALLWLSWSLCSLLQLFCCTSKCRTTSASIPAFL